MASCFSRTFILQRKFLLYSRTSTSKFFSSLFPISDKVYSNKFCFHQDSNKKINEANQVQFRYVSTDRLLPIYDLISNSDASKGLRDFLIQIHDSAGLHWWGTIISATIAMKILISLPCGVCQQHILSKLELSKSELNASVESLKKKVLLEARKKKWNEKKIKSEFDLEVRKQWKMLIVKNNCHPFKNFILFIAQFPVWLLMTLTVRKFAIDAAAVKMENPVPELQFLVGGPFWCPNLSVPDPTFILPALNALSILAVTELNLLHTQLKASNKKQSFLSRKLIPNFLRLIAVFFFFVSSVSPSGVSLFWASSSLFALMQNLLLLSPKFRKLLRIPKNPTDLTNPYSQMWIAFVEKWAKVFYRK